MDGAEKIRENRLRRMAARQGFALLKSRRRDPRAYDFGTYMLTDHYTNSVVATGDDGRGYGLTLDEVEAWLTGPKGERRPLGTRPGKGMELSTLADYRLASKHRIHRELDEQYRAGRGPT